MDTLLKAHRADAFSPGFVDRVMRRIRAMRASDENVLALWMATFRPIAIAGGFLILLLLMYNAFQNRGSWMAGVFNGHEVTIEEVFSPTYYYLVE